MPRRRSVACLALLSALAACTPAADQFAPPCPQAALLPQASDITRYRPGSGGRDLTDLAFQGRVVRVTGKCEPGPNAHTENAGLKVLMELTRGPAMVGRTTDVSYFVAVARGDDILDKRIYTNRVTFPPNLDRIYLESDPVDLRLPISPTVSGAAYTVWVGFQPTPQDLAAGQAR